MREISEVSGEVVSQRQDQERQQERHADDPCALAHAHRHRAPPHRFDDHQRRLPAVEERHGLIQCLSHPDPGYLGDADKRALYAEFLDAVAERPGLWKALPREVASWWRRRDAGETGFPEQQLGTMRRHDGPGYADLEPPAEA